MQKPNVISIQLIEFYRKPYAVVTLELLLTIGLTIFLALIIIKPTLQTMSGLSKEIAEKKELSQQLEKKSAALATAQAAYFASQEKLALLENAIPSQDTLIADLKTIERMAGENSVIVTSLGVQGMRIQPSATIATNSATISQSKDEDNQLNDRLPLSLSVEGDYLSIRDFVDRLITYRRLFVVKSVAFSIKKQQAAQALSASLIIETPYAPETYEK